MPVATDLPSIMIFAVSTSQAPWKTREAALPALQHTAQQRSRAVSQPASHKAGKQPSRFSGKMHTSAWASQTCAPADGAYSTKWPQLALHTRGHEYSWPSVTPYKQPHQRRKLAHSCGGRRYGNQAIARKRKAQSDRGAGAE